MIYCEDCRFWKDGYCERLKRETPEAGKCEKGEEY